MAESTECMVVCKCPTAEHLGEPCDCLICQEQPGSHKPKPCLIPPDKRPEVIAEEARKKEFENKEGEIVARMNKASSLAKLVYANCHRDGASGNTAMAILTVKIYDELKQAEKVL